MKTIGFIGTGTMGKPMAANLLKSKQAVTIYNRSRDKTDELVRLGAKAADSAAEVARNVDVLFTMLTDDRAVAEVYYGPGGVMEGVKPGVTVIDCSTVGPETSRRLHADLSSHFAAFLDAPVSGSEPAAEAGKLIFMAGGERDTYEAHKELLLLMGSKSYYMGAAGAGSQAKLAVNTILAVNLLGFSEGLAMAAAADLDLGAFVEIVTSGGASSKMAEMKAPKILQQDFSPQFSLALVLKDLDLASSLSRDLGVPAPLQAAARQVFQTAFNKGWGNEDLSAVIRAYSDMIGRPIGGAAGTEEGRPWGEQSGPFTGRDRRKSIRVPLGIRLQLSIYQWEREGAFHGQTIEGTLFDMSESGLQISSNYPLAEEMFIVIHFPQEADLPPVTGKIIRIERRDDGTFRYGCVLSGLPLYTKLKLEAYLHRKMEEMGIAE